MDKIFWGHLPTLENAEKEWARLDKIIRVEPTGQASCQIHFEGGSTLSVSMNATALVNEIKAVMEANQTKRRVIGGQ